MKRKTAGPVSQQNSGKIKKLEKLVERLNRIGVMLSAEKNTNNLIEMILKESMEIASCDGGSIYVRTEKDGMAYLKFQATRNLSREFPFKEFFLPVDTKSIAGYCAYSGDSFNFKSMDDVPGLLGIKYNDFFDKQINYKTCNMLVIPMKDFEGEIVGVLQLLNKKTDIGIRLDTIEDFCNYIVPFTREEEEIILSLASQTAILLERSKLMEDIEKLFDAFVESMVTTIEKRDPTTSGHSIRVARYIGKFAEAVNRTDYGKYKDLTFSEADIKELYYAGLLHDVGKIGVSESVLLKRDRLTPEELEVILYRIAYLKKELELKQVKGEIMPDEADLLGNLDEYARFISSINTKGFVTDEEQEKIRNVSSVQFTDINGMPGPLLTEHEVRNLTIKRGNLTEDERNQMNQHAAYTYQILKDIPWTKDLQEIPTIAAAHHEKLNGTGYPYRLTEERIPPQSKMLAIIDIFEALTAVDRPYKPAIPADKALKIIEEEVSRNSLDKDLYEIFLKEELYNTCLK